MTKEELWQERGSQFLAGSIEERELVEARAEGRALGACGEEMGVSKQVNFTLLMQDFWH